MNIVFIGMSGAGKTTIGKKVSVLLNRDFYDTDDLIVSEIGMTIDSFFKKYGEKKFRELESEIVYEFSKVNNSIISTGGGIVLDENNIINLKKNGKIIYLKGNIDTLFSNLKKSNIIRPLIDNEKESIGNIERLFIKRKDLYKKYSDLTINIDDKTINEIIEELLKNKNVESNHSD